MISSKVPKHTTVLIVGGGPAGSYAASLMRREGHQVVLLEMAKHPRYHVGESMLPSLRPYLRYIDLDDKFVERGFTIKPGAAFKLVQGMDPVWTDFRGIPDGLTFNVIRSEMDEIMLRHAESQGVQVFEETTVTSVKFSGSRPIAASWSNKEGATGEISFDWLIDASGRAGIMSTKYLKNRVMRESLRNVAVWGYWKDCKGIGTIDPLQKGAGYFETLSDCRGWVWTIPLHDGTTSVGIVMHESSANEKRTKLNVEGKTQSLTEHYLEQLKLAPGVKEHIIGENGYMIPGSIKSGADSSYWASRCSGDHFRIIGDAANFVDPFFSSGVHIALTGAVSAVVTICASMNNQAPEEIAQAWHDSKIGIAHTRFLFVVLGAYHTMQAPTEIFPKDVNWESYNDAFQKFLPVVTGKVDRASDLTSERVKEMMGLVLNYFDPQVSDHNVKSVAKRYGAELLSLNGPVVGPKKISEIAGNDEEAKRVLQKMDSLRVFSDDLDPRHMDRQAVCGYTSCTERGNMGLRKVTAEKNQAPVSISPTSIGSTSEMESLFTTKSRLVTAGLLLLVMVFTMKSWGLFSFA